MSKSLRFLPLLVLFGMSFFFWKGLSLNARVLPSVKIGQKLPNFTLPRLDNGALDAFNSSKGQGFLLNVWASWCEVCLEEQDFLMKLSKQGVLIYGLNYKDTVSAANAALKSWGNPYVYSVSDAEGRIALDLGVYGAPETFLIDANGVIRYRHVGALTEEAWQKMRDFL